MQNNKTHFIPSPSKAELRADTTGAIHVQVDGGEWVASEMGQEPLVKEEIG